MNNGACERCWEKGGAKYVETAKRIRSDVDFAQRVLEQASSEAQRARFRSVFGAALPANLNNVTRYHRRWTQYGLVQVDWTMPPPPPDPRDEGDEGDES
ncbi:MAG: hypothetical protein EOP08_10805 [Proteobacteria bacterium]|nr:MAG: hypothetical protein EOP08_10805 [Pseudomonadota bacterium]